MSSILKYLNPIPRYVIYALFVFSPLARASVEDWAITVILFLSILVIAAFLMRKSLYWEWKWTKTPLDMPIISLLVLSIISGIFSMHRPSSLSALSLLMSHLALFYLSVDIIQYRAYLKQFTYLIISLGVILCGFGFIKWYGFNPFPWWEYPDLEQIKLHRLSSTYVNANNFAGYLEMILPVITGLILTGYASRRKIPMIILSLLMSWALVLTYSRGGWVAAASGLLFLSVILTIDQQVNQKKILLLLGSSILIASFLILFSASLTDRFLTIWQQSFLPSFRGRIIAWHGIIKMISDYPFLGIGPGTFETIFSQYQPPGLLAYYSKAHNDYLQFLSEVGILFIPIFFWTAVQLFRTGFGKMKNTSRLIRGTTAGAMAGIVSILVHSIVDFNLHIPANSLLFTILAAIVVAPIPQHHYPPSKSGHPNKPMHQID